LLIFNKISSGVWDINPAKTTNVPYNFKNKNYKDWEDSQKRNGKKKKFTILLNIFNG